MGLDGKTSTYVSLTSRVGTRARARAAANETTETEPVDQVRARAEDILEDEAFLERAVECGVGVEAEAGEVRARVGVQVRVQARKVREVDARAEVRGDAGRGNTGQMWVRFCVIRWRREREGTYTAGAEWTATPSARQTKAVRRVAENMAITGVVRVGENR